VFEDIEACYDVERLWLIDGVRDVAGKDLCACALAGFISGGLGEFNPV
jgi:hypothetical protein